VSRSKKTVRKEILFLTQMFQLHQ